MILILKNYMLEVQQSLQNENTDIKVTMQIQNKRNIILKYTNLLEIMEIGIIGL